MDITYDDNPGCYSSGVKVTVTDLTVAPSLSTTEVIWDCPNEVINLNDYLVGKAPTGTEVIWYRLGAYWRAIWWSS